MKGGQKKSANLSTRASFLSSEEVPSLRFLSSTTSIVRFLVASLVASSVALFASCTFVANDEATSIIISKGAETHPNAILRKTEEKFNEGDNQKKFVA